MMNKLEGLVKKIVALAIVSQASALSAYAADSRINLSDDWGPSVDLISWIQRVLNLVIGLTGLMAVGFLIFSGIQYITSAGDEGKVEKATKGITYAVVGLVICLISVLIVNFVIERVVGN